MWADWTVTVAGVGVAGFAAADALLELGATVHVVDRLDGPTQRERAEILEVLGAVVHLGDDRRAPEGTQLLVVSPGVASSAPIVTDAIDRGIAIWGELELAWRLRDGEQSAAWLCVTGSVGKTATCRMLASILTVAQYRSAIAGCGGNSIIDVVMHDDVDVIVVDASAGHLSFVRSLSPVAAVCLNASVEAISSFGSEQEYLEALARVYANCQESAVYNVEDPATMTMVEQADVVEGCRAIGFTTGVPSISMVGIVEGQLVDRAFIEKRADSAQPLAWTADVVSSTPQDVSNALAAAAMARSFGVPHADVGRGLRQI